MIVKKVSLVLLTSIILIFNTVVYANDNNNYFNDGSGCYDYTTVMTPNGSFVSVAIIDEDDDHNLVEFYNQEIRTKFPNAIFISTSTIKYNCHSYA